MNKPVFLVLSLLFSIYAFAQDIPFESTPLNEKGDLSEKMVDGINSFYYDKIKEEIKSREVLWKEFMQESTSEEFINENKAFLKARLGIIQRRERPKMELLVDSFMNPLEMATAKVLIKAVRWNVHDQLFSEGIYLKPLSKIQARIVIIPDADIPPENLAGINGDVQSWFGIAYRLAAQGYEVIIPALINREDTWSGNPALERWTNQPHREWLYRQSYELGRHIIGEEIQKVLSAVDWFENQSENVEAPIGVMGYGEGGLLAFYSGALDERISSTLVSGYFNERNEVWKEPIYRNIFGVASKMGDAEIATLYHPRTLVVEHCEFPRVNGPPRPQTGRSGAAPGVISTPDFVAVEREWNRLKVLRPESDKNAHLFNSINDNRGEPYSEQSLKWFSASLGIPLGDIRKPVQFPAMSDSWTQSDDRQKRLVRNMQRVFQDEMNRCERTRDVFFWDKVQGVSSTEMEKNKTELRKELWETLGRLPDPDVPANPRARVVERNEKWTRYEVVLDVWPEVFAWGLMTIPNDLQKGDKRPVVVCQHGLEGLPKDVVMTDPEYEKFRAYKGYATRLAELGFITFAPHNPYRGGDKFRVLQRMANPIGYSLFSVIIGQNQRILEWLKGLEFVDEARIGFYGLSYGGKTAMRVPAVLEDYALSVCSGDFNEWIRKNVSVDLKYSYVFTGEYEMPEWNLGQTFNYAEMAALIAPRPFMVEFGYKDGIGSVEWVNYEFGKVRKHYDLTGISERLDKELFIGPHTINGEGTFEFLIDQLDP